MNEVRLTDEKINATSGLVGIGEHVSRLIHWTVPDVGYPEFNEHVRPRRLRIDASRRNDFAFEQNRCCFQPFLERAYSLATARVDVFIVVR